MSRSRDWWIVAACVIAICALVSVMVWDEMMQLPRTECFERGYSEVQFSSTAMYCIKVDNGHTVVLKLNRYKPAAIHGRTTP